MATEADVIKTEAAFTRSELLLKSNLTLTRTHHVAVSLNQLNLPVFVAMLGSN